MTKNLEGITFLDPVVRDCPFDTYKRLHCAAPAILDGSNNAWAVTKYDGIRKVMLNPDTYSTDGFVNAIRNGGRATKARKICREYCGEPWLTPTRNIRLALDNNDLKHAPGLPLQLHKKLHIEFECN